jgi:serine phosphatase RsbU (regulator of sigma subunit)
MTLMEKTGRIIGVTEKTKYNSIELDFNEEDELILFTDGLTEEWNEDKEEYGEKRLENWIQAHKKISSEKFMDGILSDLKKFMGTIPMQDDISIIRVSHNKNKLLLFLIIDFLN